MASEVARTYAYGLLTLGPHESLVYETKDDSRAALRRRIFSAAEQMRNHSHNIPSVTGSLLVRAEKCIATGGGHFEQVV